MSNPIKCFTCGKVLADKYVYYENKIRSIKKANSQTENMDRLSYLTKNNMNITPEGEVLNELKLTKLCCRRHLLTGVDIYS